MQVGLFLAKANNQSQNCIINFNCLTNNWYQSSKLVDPMEVNASIAKVDVVKFDRIGNFELWQRRLKDLLV